MATGGCRTSEGSSGAGGGYDRNTLVFDTHHNALMVDNLPLIQRLIHMDILRNHLLVHSVANYEALQLIMAPVTEFQRVEQLIDHVRVGTVKRFNALVRALQDSDQAHVLPLLGVEHSKGTDSPPLKKVRNEASGNQDDTDLLEGIKDHCRYYIREILRVPQLDINHDEIHDIQPYLIKIMVQKKERKAGTETLEPIDDADIFRMLKDAEVPVAVLLSAGPGQGKSTFIKSYIRKWCQTQLQRPTPLKQVMVYIPAVRIEQDIWAAVKQNIHCRNQKRKEAVLKFIHSECEDNILFVDGTDETRDPETVQNIQDFVTEAKNMDTYRVFVSTRDNLSNVKHSDFHRHIHIQGYLTEQGLEYIEKYLHEDKFTKQVTMIRNLKDSHNISGILTNPLRSHILCILSVNNCIDINNVQHLNIGHLYKALDDMVIERERKAKTPDDDIKGFDTDHQNFYLMVLFSMLNNRVDINDDMLNTFNLAKDFCLVRLMTRTFSGLTTKGKSRFIYVAPHETFLEHWVAQGVLCLPKPLQDVVIFYLCSKPVFNNIILFISWGISNCQSENKMSQFQDIISIIVLTMISQTANNPDDEVFTTLRAECEIAANDLEKTRALHFTPECLLQGDNKSLFDIYAKVQNIITKILMDNTIDRMGKKAWFGSICNMDSDTTVVGSHVWLCLDTLSNIVKEEVADKLLGYMLPCTTVSSRGDTKVKRTYHRVTNTTRWGVVEQEEGTHFYHTCTWCPADAAVILKQHWKPDAEQDTSQNTATPPTHTCIQPPQTPKMDTLGVYCNAYTKFGTFPPRTFSSDKWRAVLINLLPCKTVAIELGPVRLPISSPWMADARSILPVMQAVSSAREIPAEKVIMYNGHVKVSELSQWVDSLGSNTYSIELSASKVLVDDENMDVAQLRTIRDELKAMIGLHASQWYTDDGCKISL